MNSIDERLRHLIKNERDKEINRINPKDYLFFVETSEGSLISRGYRSKISANALIPLLKLGKGDKLRVVRRVICKDGDR